MYELMKGLASTNNWGFTYARRDFANLYDEMDIGKVEVFLDPVRITDVFSDTNTVESRQYNGSFMILVSSQLADDYEDRYIENIKPLLDSSINTLLRGIRCDGGYMIDTWRKTEVINMFDYGLDGILVEYQLTEDV